MEMLPSVKRAAPAGMPDREANAQVENQQSDSARRDRTWSRK